MPLDIASILARFSKLNIVVIGDIMLDHYIMGDATRISPEAPVPVVSVARDTYVPGGAANVGNNFAGLGVPTTLIGSYTDDPESKLLNDVLQQRQIQLSPLGKRDGATTIVKTRVVVQRQQLCRIDREAKPAAYALDAQLQSPEFLKLIQQADAILFSDYAKGVINDALLHTVRTTVAQSSKAPLLVVDPKPKRHLNLSGMTVMTPNRSEALQMAGFDSSPDADFDDEAVAAAIFQAYNPEKLVITLGADGMLLGEHGKIIGRIATEAQEVFDVSGAGDTVVSVLTAALAAGENLLDAATLANKAAGIVVRHLGTAPITQKELLA
ncbi:PfkB family carbohydrate kinase [Coraliomargarita sp. SDUM461004]|uniref:PfkB family carbohydrate kinase n=1 Tax=Thalassobacterium sedimentorum TaxID=3041258 RepID=A0ABU1AK21_9BACT|nr:PfkB family carbohydrate kinase [Coraliomargarita sp. SDUM461004]MDQ8195162.1 PfkB family carbohydrate kinase [Coraliomargarita sp. SDUM461004]